MAFLAPAIIRTSRFPLVLRNIKPISRLGIRPSTTSSQVQIRSLSSYEKVPSDTVMESTDTLVDRVLNHWFGSLDVPRFHIFQTQWDLWYSGTEEIDEQIRMMFGSEVEMALQGKLDHLIASEQYQVKGDLALVILLDQHARNIYRKTAKAFAGDSKTRDIVMGLLNADRWSTAKNILPTVAQSRLLLALMHQESVADLDLCKDKIEDLLKDCLDAGDEASGCQKALRDMIGYTERHRVILARFGRYPHRNDVLGRESTEEELEFLKDCPRFGQ